MQARPLLASLLLVPLALAGCMEALDESRTTDDDGDADERRLVVDVPQDATRMQVDVRAEGQSGEADVTVLVEDEAGANLAEDTFSVSEGATRLEVDAAGHDRMVVVVRVVDGDATLDVEVTAVVPGQPAVIVVRETVVVRVEHVTPPPATTMPPTPPPGTTLPSPTPTPPSPTPTAPTNGTNATNETNETG